MAVEHVDVVIVGAGLSGVGAACHLRARSPRRTYAILESREAIGGTWDLFRYPGVRSDSDMFTLGYSFRPWKGSTAIADAGSIRDYIRETARRFGVDRHIRFSHRVVRAEWSSADARWTVIAERTDTGETVTLTCSFLSMCSGYYRYDKGYTPEFAGAERFAGTIVHPQHWPEDLDYDGKRVAVIGSGATAMTLVPAMAKRAAHVTMVQRSPSYVVAQPARDELAAKLEGKIPATLAYAIVRWKHVLLAMLSFQLSRKRPEFMKSMLRKGLLAQLPAGFDVDKHFSPRYDPWDQRLCLVPDGDLFAAIRDGSVSIETDAIDTFTEKGLRLRSGTEVEADVVVTATGLNLLALGGLTLCVDGREVDPAKTVAYKGMMLSGVPNLSLTIGYTNASWTLKADLVAGYVCRLLDHMDAHGYQTVTPVEPGFAGADGLPPLIDLKAGYVLRGVAMLPRQGPSAPWRLYQNYLRDIRLMRRGRVDDGAVRFGRVPARAKSPAPVA
jgi:monooxygenase